MRVAIGADHAGFRLKDHLAEMLRDDGWEIDDHGTHSTESVDYPDVAAVVARAVAGGEAARGVLVCGTGLGVALAACKVPGALAATCNEILSARMARAHNDANIVTLGARVVGPGVAEEIVRTFLATDFEGGRHARRRDKILALEA
ncbi:MAG: ribose 5-phosphate isomerase B [Acidobacteriota bacterium]